jgi:23S rRNA (guanosine2251-2'-O)-methyltransferase
MTTSATVGGEQVEGRRAVAELLQAGTRRVKVVYVSSAAARDPGVAEVVELAGRAARVVAPEKLEHHARTDVHQGVVALAAPLRAADLDDLLGPPGAFLVALDGVTDPRNLGAVMRSAETAGATGVVLPRHRAAHVTPAVTKAAAGAIEHLPIALVGGIPNALDRAQRAGCWTVGLDEHGTTPLYDLDLADQRIMLVLGAEGRGLARLTRERCDVLVRIPVQGHVPSLNVAAAATLACHEVARRRRQPNDDVRYSSS